jgi:hypothetical protein
VQLQAGSGHGGWRADVQVLHTLGQLSNHPVDLQGTTRWRPVQAQRPDAVLHERGLASSSWHQLPDDMRCAVESVLTTAACLLRDMVVIAGDASEQAPGLGNRHAHLADTALRRGDSKVGHLRKYWFIILCTSVSLQSTRAGGASASAEAQLQDFHARFDQHPPAQRALAAAATP